MNKHAAYGASSLADGIRSRFFDDINGLRMPRNTGPFLTEGQMLVIRRWISEGAANN